MDNIINVVINGITYIISNIDVDNTGKISFDVVSSNGKITKNDENLLQKFFIDAIKTHIKEQ